MNRREAEKELSDLAPYVSPAGVKYAATMQMALAEFMSTPGADGREAFMAIGASFTTMTEYMDPDDAKWCLDNFISMATKRVADQRRMKTQ